jgi:DNA-binding transcriptional ArsR family regulator
MSPTSEKIIAALAGGREMTRQQIGLEIGHPKRTVGHNLQVLSGLKIVEPCGWGEKEGRGPHPMLWRVKR